MENMIDIYELTYCDENMVGAIRKLLLQLSTSCMEFDINMLRYIVESKNSTLYIAEYEGKVCGMLTLAHYKAPTGTKLWIEDVVVDEAVRGKSIGRRLVLNAIERAKEIGGTLMLTSRPSRVAANALYRSIGFEQRETNVYKIKL